MINEANEPSSACRLWRICKVETSTPPKVAAPLSGRNDPTSSCPRVWALEAGYRRVASQKCLGNVRHAKKSFRSLMAFDCSLHFCAFYYPKLRDAILAREDRAHSDKSTAMQLSIRQARAMQIWRPFSCPGAEHRRAGLVAGLGEGRAPQRTQSRRIYSMQKAIIVGDWRNTFARAFVSFSYEKTPGSCSSNRNSNSITSGRASF